MKKIKYLSTVFLLVLSFSLPAFAREPLNLGLIKHQLAIYHDSGQYLHDIASVSHRAMRYIKQRVQQNKRALHPGKLALVLDIDETSLSNYQDMKDLGYGGNPKLWAIGIDKATTPAIGPMLKIYQFAAQNDIAIFFITGRQEDLREATVKNLEKAGYTKWNGLSLKPKEYQQKSIIPYKTSERAKIAKAGYIIVANIGDQQSDLEGGYAERSFKLPNPYYLIP